MSSQPEGVVLRRGVGEFLEEVLQAMHSIPGSTRWTMSRLEALLAGGDMSVAAMTASRRLVGFALAYPGFGLNPFLYPDECVILRRLIVSPDHRRQGVGATLLREVFARASPRAVAWQTSVKNAAALSWFDRMSLSPKGEISRGDSRDCIYWIATDGGE
jgi:GNAT superfamily N-acetyltransferase